MRWERGSRYRIQYRSESGRITLRNIDLIDYYTSCNDILYLRAYCHLRNEERTFRADRILSVRKLETKNWEVPAAPALTSTLCPTHSISSILSGVSTPSPSPQDPFIFTLSKDTNRPPDPETPKTTTMLLEKIKKGIANLFGYAFMFFLIALFLDHEGLLDTRPAYSPISKVSSISSYSSTSSIPKWSPELKPAPPPKPLVEETRIGGYTLKTIRYGGVESYEVPALGIKTSDKREAVAAIRIPAFIQATGLNDSALIEQYLAADLNRSGRLSFEELEAFQKKTVLAFKYQENELALRPDKFIAAGGGDCEDFALYTAGLLRFWGWESYIGLLRPEYESPGHAVCLSYETEPFSESYVYYNLQSWTTVDGTALKPGFYVPIDYEYVGGISSAVKKGWKLREVYTPEKAWGLQM
ncbi:MAG TPA: WYL domain-containing protein [Spirochaetales bacterium]|nr:WYL domain-containing protein [Spirochaetales bacterium]